ncbi:MAG: hypothetical protein HN932_12815 [Candidatus Marinimicrobia bacterium]|jgi:hypothetical protein|nr:hypothetical protein [Candidatus Neomarinimicrobiota bacterium]MBT7339095.1 hypothetical protein [Candidatus Jacksonbacteria bacterium]
MPAKKPAAEITIYLMNLKPTFSETTVTSGTVAELRKELDLGSDQSVSVNSIVAADDACIREGDRVSVVKKNKTGGQ